jgi:hypothetical protein
MLFPDKVIVVVFTDLISITSANLVAKRDAIHPCGPSRHARSDTTPHTTPAGLTRLSLRVLALRRALRRATWSGLPRACTRRTRRRGRGSPRKRRWPTRTQRVVGHVQRIVRKLALCYEHECSHGRMARGKRSILLASPFCVFLFFSFLFLKCVWVFWFCCYPLSLVNTGTDGSVFHPC